jgi:hypothetical protein
MKALLFILPVVSLLFTGCNESNPPTGGRPVAEGGSSNAVTEYFQAAAQAQQRAARTVDVVGLNKAIEAFYVQEGRFPKTLEELVDRGSLRKLPEPPAGYKFDYDTNNGILKLEKDSTKDLLPATEKP